MKSSSLLRLALFALPLASLSDSAPARATRPIVKLQYKSGDASVLWKKALSPTCEDQIAIDVSFSQTFEWNRDARTGRQLVDEVPLFATVSGPSRQGEDCSGFYQFFIGADPRALGKNNSSDDAFKFRGTAGATLETTPIVSSDGFTTSSLSFDLTWKAAGSEKVVTQACERLAYDPDTNTCAAVSYREVVRAQEVSGTVTGTLTVAGATTPYNLSIPADVSVDPTATRIRTLNLVEVLVSGDACNCPPAKDVTIVE